MDSSLTVPRPLTVKGVLWDPANGDYLVEAYDPVSRLYHGPHLVRLAAPGHLNATLAPGPDDSHNLNDHNLERLREGKSGTWNTHEDRWRVLIASSLVDPSPNGLPPSLFWDRGKAEWELREPMAPAPVVGPGFATRPAHPIGPSILDMQASPPVFVKRVDLTTCNGVPTAVTFWIMGHRGLHLSLESEYLLGRLDDDWDEGAEIRLYDVDPFGRVGLYPLTEPFDDWWDQEIWVHVRPETKTVWAVVSTDRDGNSVERVAHRWIPLQEDAFKSLDGTIVVRVHQDFVALFDLEDYRRGFPEDREVGISLEQVDAYSIDWHPHDSSEGK